MYVDIHYIYVVLACLVGVMSTLTHGAVAKEGVTKAARFVDVKPITVVDQPYPLPPPTPGIPMTIESKVLGPFRIWHLMGLVLCFLLVVTVVVCCFIECRIPRTKQEIMDRRMRGGGGGNASVAPAAETPGTVSISATRVLANGVRPPVGRGTSHAGGTTSGLTQPRRFGGVETPLVLSPAALLNRPPNTKGNPRPTQVGAAKSMASIPPNSFGKK